ncbi:MAG TPA: HAMP domain-containing sensor histidine kinase [Methylomirabilota bacterium]|nr:HAMP domain-containing sensor histidine kinase [Methylomirabilota bacterium]
MFFASLRRLRHTTGVRLTLWYCGAFMVSTLAVLSVAYFLLASTLQRKDREAIQLQLQQCLLAYQRGGVAAVENEIATQKNQAGKIVFFVRVADQDRHTLSMTIPSKWERFDLSQLDVEHEGKPQKWMQIPARGEDEVLEVASSRLPDGVLIQVGLSTEEREDVLEDFLGVLAGIVLPVMLVGLGSGAFFAMRALRPLRALTQTLQSILSTGQLTARASVRATGDELEELSALFNRMLDRIEVLIVGMRSALDNVAHDLRTPMTRLRGMAEMALQEHGRGEGAHAALANCIEESDRILAMLNTLMDISEAETGAMRLDLQPVRVREVVAQVVDLYADVAEDKGVTVSLAIPEALCIVADPNRIQQVFANLLDNAIKYTPPHGAVTISGEQHDYQVILTVVDTGMGIAAEDLPRIWDRLYRGDKSRSQRGLGLGLSLVKAVVHAHQGEVTVCSQPGGGAQFSLSFPSVSSS